MANVTAEFTSHGGADREQTLRQYPRDAIRVTERSLNPDKLVLSYDHPSDMLLIFLQGRERRSVVVGGTDYRFLLVDPETNELVGLQIEDFLARAVNDEPPLIELLEYAELRGITPAEVRRERRRALNHGNQSAGRSESELPSRRPAANRKLELVQALLNDGRFGLPVSRSRGAA